MSDLNYKITFGSGVDVSVSSDKGKVTGVSFGGADASQISNGIGIGVGMKVSDVVPALEKFGWGFEEVKGKRDSKSEKSSE